MYLWQAEPADASAAVAFTVCVTATRTQHRCSTLAMAADNSMCCHSHASSWHGPLATPVLLPGVGAVMGMPHGAWHTAVALRRLYSHDIWAAMDL